MEFKELFMKLLPIIAVVLLLFCTCISIYFIITNINNQNAVSNLGNTTNELRTEIQQAKNDLTSQVQAGLASAKMGLPGPVGQQGPIGPPGGIFASAGPLMCMANQKVATPTFGKGEQSIVYLDTKKYSPIQFWYLENKTNGTVVVKNKFTGKCLTANDLGEIYSDTCTNQQNQQFYWNPDMKLSSISKPNYCIALQDFARTSSNSFNSYNFRTLDQANGSATGTVSRLKLDLCSSSLNPNQTWYVGT